MCSRYDSRHTTANYLMYFLKEIYHFSSDEIIVKGKNLGMVLFRYLDNRDKDIERGVALTTCLIFFFAKQSLIG